ncbi:MAG: four helix bundle protein, partial [Candidatus Promineifilaceae bacterium]
KQAVRAVDSIGANIAEAYGRYHYGEKLQFFYYARGSLFETKYWLNRGQARGLFNPNQFQQLSKSLSKLAQQLNSLANKTKEQKNSGRLSKEIAEEGADYHISGNLSPEHILDEDFILFSPQDIDFLESVPTKSITNYELPITKHHE